MIRTRPDGEHHTWAENGAPNGHKVFAGLPSKTPDRGQIDIQPDGICLDAAGNLTTSNVAFGGPKKDQLFTTAALKSGRGGLFRIDLGVKGLVILPPKR